MAETTIQQMASSPTDMLVALRMRLFSFDGRIGRQQYVSTMIGAAVASLSLSALLFWALAFCPFGQRASWLSSFWCSTSCSPGAP